MTDIKVEPVVIKYPDTCENFSHILSCEKCLKKLKEKFDLIEPKNEPKQINTEYLTNTNKNNDILKFINDNFIIIIISILLLFILNNRQERSCYYCR